MHITNFGIQLNFHYCYQEKGWPSKTCLTPFSTGRANGNIQDEWWRKETLDMGTDQEYAIHSQGMHCSDSETSPMFSTYKMLIISLFNHHYIHLLIDLFAFVYIALVGSGDPGEFEDGKHHIVHIQGGCG